MSKQSKAGRLSRLMCSVEYASERLIAEALKYAAGREAFKHHSNLHEAARYYAARVRALARVAP